MEETVKFEMTKEEAAEFQVSLAEFLAKSKQILDTMDANQREIEQYRADTRAVIDRLDQRGRLECGSNF